MGGFATVLPVTGLNNGFPGTPSRLGDRVITARPILSTTPNNVSFGAPMVIVPAAGGGDSFQSVADYIAGGGAFTAAKLAAIAVRNIKTNLSYITQFNNTNGAAPVTNYYAPGEMAEGLERGNLTVVCNVGTPASQGQVYIRTLVNAAIPAGVVGGFEAAADGTNSVAIPNLVFRTGSLDGNNVVEVTLLTRQAA